MYSIHAGPIGHILLMYNPMNHRVGHIGHIDLIPK